MQKIKVHVFRDGERYPILVDERGLPDFWVTLFVTEELRRHAAATTIESYIRDLLHLKRWEAINERDLLAEFSEGRFLSDADIYSIADHCRLDVRSLNAYMRNQISPSVVQLNAAFPATSQTLDVVSSDHYTNRLSRIAEFLRFSARAMLRRRANFVDLSREIEAMAKALRAQKSKARSGRGYGGDPDAKAPPPQVFDAIMEVIKEDSADNPYKNPGVRYRNALLFELMYETGLRSGEVLALQIGDVDFQMHSVSVVRRHDNPEDPRARQPTVKTAERRIPIKKSLAERIWTYVMDVRAKIPGANRHPFIFVTHKRGNHSGAPISDSTFRIRVLEPATQTRPDLFDEIRRHGFRHNFNYHLSRRIDEHNRKAKSDPNTEAINEKKEMQIRKQLNGWRSDKTAETYNLRHIKEEATKLMLEDMKHQSKIKNKDK